MGFYWLCSDGFLLVVLWWVFVGLVVLAGFAVSLAMGCGCHYRFGRGLWVSPSVWSWAMGRGCGARFFLLGLLGSNGGSVSGYSGGSEVGCACVVGRRLICGAGLAMQWVVVW